MSAPVTTARPAGPRRLGVPARPTVALFLPSLPAGTRNGIASYLRGMIRGLRGIGYRVCCYESGTDGSATRWTDGGPEWADSRVYAPTADGVGAALDAARAADVVIKAGGTGAFDDWLDAEIPRLAAEHRHVLYWDLDAPATLVRMRDDPQDPFRRQVGRYELVLTRGGGPRAVAEYESLGARCCRPIHAAFDADSEFPPAWDGRFAGDLGFLGNRRAGRETRVHELFLEPARCLPELRFVLGGRGWDGNVEFASNVRYVGGVPAPDRPAFYRAVRAMLCVSGDDRAVLQGSPSAGLFDAAGAGACVVCDARDGIEDFLEPGHEVLCVGSGVEFVEATAALSGDEARRIGDAARRRVLAAHTYDHRARELHALLESGPALRRA